MNITFFSKIKNLFLYIRNREKLNNIIDVVEKLAMSSDIREHQTIFYIVKMYTDSINYHNNLHILYYGHQCKSKKEIDSIITNTECKFKYDKTYKINLGKIPIITEIWNKDRLVNNLSYIGNSKNIWEEQPNNHFFKLYLPIGLIYVYNGNHSINCGIIKSIGELEFCPHKLNTAIYDISHLYDILYFDGIYYRYLSNNEILSTTTFECGCLFEIGRIVKKYNIDFLEFLENDID